jgi:hypothetical protein
MGGFRVLLLTLIAGVTAASCNSAVLSPTLPPDAPEDFTGLCTGWADKYPLPFAGYATRRELSFPDGNGINNDERVFAIVTRDRISQQPNRGPAMVARGLCMIHEGDGGTEFTGVADDWVAAR